ncbi:hypothetical protein D0T23_21140 [Duganella sp. BJB475]|nr:hypothetical protein D0T23_21140 [Duganella sp. BJB475]RFP29740.1 hypothetical protein D0T21_17895 [Duganella sp. BJB476]
MMGNKAVAFAQVAAITEVLKQNGKDTFTVKLLVNSVEVRCEKVSMQELSILCKKMDITVDELINANARTPMKVASLHI